MNTAEHPETLIPQIPLPAAPNENSKENKTTFIPQLGFGTYKINPNKTQKLVETALELGYRHIDTAQMYGNEKAVGAAIHASGLPRTEIFLTSKLNNPNHEPDTARKSLEKTLQDLRTDYLDLFLIHWPMPRAYNGDYPKLWHQMLDFAAENLSRHVGVSNFQIEHLQRLIDEVGVFPAVNQIEAHPWFNNNAVREFSKSHGAIIQAWSPLARARFFDDPTLLSHAQRLKHTPAQLVLRWALERGDVVFPKSDRPERMRENLQLFDFQLDTPARKALNEMNLGEEGRTGSHPDNVN